jgi:hypothetical protein
MIMVRTNSLMHPVQDDDSVGKDRPSDGRDQGLGDRNEPPALVSPSTLRRQEHYRQGWPQPYKLHFRISYLAVLWLIEMGYSSATRYINKVVEKKEQSLTFQTLFEIPFQSLGTGELR